MSEALATGNVIKMPSRNRRPKRTWRKVAITVAVGLLALICGLMAFYLWEDIGETSATEALAKEAKVDSAEPDWDQLQSVGSGVNMWLTVENTPISGAVMQSRADDPDYWLSHDLWGNYSRVGSLAVDWETSVEEPNVLIYGHHLDSGGAFSSIFQAFKPEVFDSIGNAVLKTPEKTLVARPLFAFKTVQSDLLVQTFSFKTPLAKDPLAQDLLPEAAKTPKAGEVDPCPVFGEWLEQMALKATAKSDDAQAVMDNCSQVLTLVTCSEMRAGQPGRTVVVFGVV